MGENVAERFIDYLLGIIRDAGKPLSIAEISQKTQMKTTMIRYYLNRLVHDEVLFKIPGNGSSFRYGIRKVGAPKVIVKMRSPVEAREITPAGLAQLLRSLAQKKWIPKTTKSASAVPYAITKLYHFAHDVAMGGKRTQEDYDNVRAELRQYHDDLVTSLATVKGILDKPELWDSKDSARWLLSSGGSSADYEDLANAAEEVQH